MDAVILTPAYRGILSSNSRYGKVALKPQRVDGVPETASEGKLL